jgi:2-methylisocitrate lyase-like PEP mutase family enzyme
MTRPSRSRLFRVTAAGRFRELHREGLFLLPNPWDVGSAKLLASLGFQALATTSAGFAWSLGRLDGEVGRDELVAHVASLAEATDLPLNVDSEQCYPRDPGGVAATVRMLAEAGAAGFSIEDYDPVQDRIEDVDVAVARVAEAVAAAHEDDEPLVVTARAENHLRGVDDVDDTIERLCAYRDAGADAVYAPWLADLGAIERIVREVGLPVNVLALPHGPSVAELERAGVRRVSTGGHLARAAYGALLTAAEELRETGAPGYFERAAPPEALKSAFGAR